MSKKVFRASLSQRSIEDLKQQLIRYRDDILPYKCEQLVERLTERGITVANFSISISPLWRYVHINSTISPAQAGTKAMIIATGDIFKNEGYEDFNVLLAIEFGAGIHYNQKENPKADQFGLGVGTFPGQIHAFEDGWYYFDEKSKKWHYTHGIKATMPMYNTSKWIQENAVKICREVFR